MIYFHWKKKNLQLEIAVEVLLEILKVIFQLLNAKVYQNLCKGEGSGTEG